MIIVNYVKPGTAHREEPETEKGTRRTRETTEETGKHCYQE
jgi:hypothetical protein